MVGRLKLHFFLVALVIIISVLGVIVPTIPGFSLVAAQYQLSAGAALSMILLALAMNFKYLCIRQNALVCIILFVVVYFITQFALPEQYYNLKIRTGILESVFGFMVSLAIISIRTPSLVQWGQLLFTITLFANFFIALGYFLEVQSLTSFPFKYSVSASLQLMILSILGMRINPGQGFIAIFSGSKIGNIMVRKLLLQVIITVIILGYLRLQVYKMQLFSNEFALTLTIIIFISLFCILVSRIAAKLNSIEDKRIFSEERFRILFDSNPNGIVIINSSGNIELSNNKCSDIFKYSKSELFRQGIDIIFPAQSITDKSTWPSKNSNHTTDEVCFNELNIQGITKHGNQIPLQVQLNYIRIKDEDVIIASIIDISERTARENVIQEQMLELSARNEEIQQFAYIASHDLQEPLRTIRNYITLINEDFKALPLELYKYLADMESAAGRMSKLLNYLLEYGKLGVKSSSDAVDLNNTINCVVSDLNLLLSSNNAHVIIVNKLPHIHGYPLELAQLYQNLIQNAVKFSGNKNSEILIGVKTLDSKSIFYVRDNGVGIEPVYHKKIFRMFQKLNPQTEGYGVGLANCKKIVDLHRGKIWVESEKGAGSTFFFTLFDTDIVSQT